jgi:CHAD domain
MKARKVKKLDPAGPLLENAARIIRVRADELRSFVAAALDPDRETEQHDMRIAAKRLRYVLEATEFCFGKPAVKARKRAKEIQDVLGELHDCDVMLPRIDAHAAELRHEDAARIRAKAGDAAELDPELSARAPHRTAYRGLEILAVHVEARRRLLFDRFTELWAQTEDERIFERLEHAIERKVNERREHRRALARAEEAARELQEAEAAERDAAARAQTAAEELRSAQQQAGGDSAGDGGASPAV